VHRGKNTAVEEIKKIAEPQWDTILKALYGKRCVPFLGAGVNLKCFDDDVGLPLGSDVALMFAAELTRQSRGRNVRPTVQRQPIKDYRGRREVASQYIKAQASERQLLDEQVKTTLMQILPEDDSTDILAHIITEDDFARSHYDLLRLALEDLPKVSLRYRAFVNLQTFVEKLQEMIPDTTSRPSRLLRNLASMSLPLIVTTNYDRLMERAFELFSAEDLRDARRFTEVVQQETLISRVLYSLLSLDFRKWLSTLDANELAPNDLQARWAAALNLLIQTHRISHLEPYLSSSTPLEDDALKNIIEQPTTVAQVRENRHFLETAYNAAIRSVERNYKVMVQPLVSINGKQENATRDDLSRFEGTILYKLHGTFSDKGPVRETRPVITEEDYIEFLTYIGGKGEGIENQIVEKIKGSTMLFLGYSLEDWNFRALFKGLIEQVTPDDRPLSFAIQKNPTRFWVDHWNKKSVHVFDMDLGQFTLEMENRFREYKAQEDKKRADEEEKKNREIAETFRNLGRTRQKIDSNEEDEDL
jgi:hypothetical protein